MDEPLKYHVYLIISDGYPDKFYKGFTTNIAKQLSEHNQGKVKSIAAYRPWCMQTVISFDSEKRAHVIEKYLKSHSGRAFSSKHF
jgi:putative endonuclease